MQQTFDRWTAALTGGFPKPFTRRGDHAAALLYRWSAALRTTPAARKESFNRFTNPPDQTDKSNESPKFGIIQGNASDLMHGLPLQSVYAADNEPYHEPLRPLTVVYAPLQMVATLTRISQMTSRILAHDLR